MPDRPVWIALVNVRQSDPDAEIFNGEGAFVNVVGPGFSVSDFQVAINAKANKIGLLVLDIEDPELFAVRVAAHHVASELHELAEVAEQSGTVQFGTFHTYPKETDIH